MKIKIPVEGFSQPLTPPAVYKLNFVGHKEKVSEKSGNTSINFEANIMSEGPDPKIKTVGKKAFINCTLSEKSLWNLDALLEATSGAGLPRGQEMSEEEIIAFAIPRIMGKNIVAKCSHSTYEGKPQENWGNFAALK